MSPSRVVVDGSNIATEGRSLPSLVQLDEAVRAYSEDHPDDEIIVVVDATFAHRIPESERPMFEEAAAHNELVYPPAGAVGRGDAFLLRIAEKTDAVVLSNDSFQEFHGEHDWLFDKGRLVGGTPVPGVGWIFVDRTPVRGPKSREAVKEARRGKARIGSKEASQPMPVPKAPPPRKSEQKPALRAAIEVATEEAVSPAGSNGTEGVDGTDGAEGADGARGTRRRRRRRKSTASAHAAALPTVNTPLTFIQFVAEYQPGATVEGEVESFASHGAFVLVGDARCYLPLSAMGNPPPRSAREVLQKGETRTFVVQALDAPRRGVELALPGFEQVAGRPTDETVEAEIEEAPPPADHAPPKHEPAKRSARSRKKAPAEAAPAEARAAAGDAVAETSPVRGRRTKKAAVPAEPPAVAPTPTLDAPAAEAPPPARGRRGKKAAMPAEPAGAVLVGAPDGSPPAEEPAPRARKATRAAPAVEPEVPIPARKARVKKAPPSLPPEESPVAPEPPPPVEPVAPAPAKRARRMAKAVAEQLITPEPSAPEPLAEPAAPPPPSKKAAVKKAPAKEAVAAAPPAEAAPVKAVKKVKKAPAATAKKVPPTKKAPVAAKVAPAKKAPVAAKVAPAKKAPVAAKAAPAKKAPVAAKVAPAKKAAGTKRAPAAKKAPAKKAPAAKKVAPPH